MKKSQCLFHDGICRYKTTDPKYGDVAFIIGSTAPEFSKDIEIIKEILDKYNYYGYFAKDEIDPGCEMFCQKICRNIRFSLFSIVFYNSPVHKATKSLPEEKSLRLIYPEFLSYNELLYPSPNVWFEYGLLFGLRDRKNIVPIFKEGLDQRPFDVQGLETISYSNTSDLKEKLGHFLKTKKWVVDREEYEMKTDYEDLRKSPSIYYLNRQLELMENREDPLERQEILGNFRHHIHNTLEPPISDERIEILFKTLEMMHNWIRDPDLRSICLDILSFGNFERIPMLTIKWKELLPIIEELKTEFWNELSLLEKKRLLIILLRMRKGEYDFLKVLAESSIKEWSEEEFPTLKDVFDFTELVRDFPEDVEKLDKSLQDLRVAVKKENDQPEILLQRATYLIKKIDEAFQFLY